MEKKEAVFRAEKAIPDTTADISAYSTKNSKKRQKFSQKTIFRSSLRIENKGKKISCRSNPLARKNF